MTMILYYVYNINTKHIQYININVLLMFIDDLKRFAGVLNKKERLNSNAFPFMLSFDYYLSPHYK